MNMTKAELSALIAERTALYHKPIHTYAESFDQQRRLERALETRKKPAHLRQAEWELYLQEVEAGTYAPDRQHEVELYDYSGL